MKMDEETRKRVIQEAESQFKRAPKELIRKVTKRLINKPKPDAC